MKAFLLFTLAAASLSAAPVGEIVTAGNFIHVVRNIDQTLAFYHDVVGLDLALAPGAAAPAVPRPYTDNPFVAKLYGAPEARFRGGNVRTPDPAVNLEFVDLGGVNNQQAVRPRPQDPGASVVILTVRSLDAALDKVRGRWAPRS